MKTKSLLISGSKGFSLVELLVVIAVIAIIAAIAIPNIANVTASANAAKDQRNAQTIASVAAAARAAGFAGTWGSGTTAAAMLASGTVVAVVGSNTMSFSVPALTPADLTGANYFLSATSTPSGLDQIVYSSTSNTPGSQ